MTYTKITNDNSDVVVTESLKIVTTGSTPYPFEMQLSNADSFNTVLSVTPYGTLSPLGGIAFSGIKTIDADYNMVPGDSVILCDSTSNRIEIGITADALLDGQLVIIKDAVGAATTNKITITPIGIHIDADTAWEIKRDFNSVTMIFDKGNARLSIVGLIT